MNFHILTCEYPPQIGGVSDHSFSLAAGLGAAGYDVHVWAPAAARASAAPGVEVHRDLGRFTLVDLQRVEQALNAFAPPRRLLVQWVPHGYGWRSLNVPLAAWIAKRGLIDGDRIELVVHEPYMPLSANPAHLAAALVHRLMLATVAIGAARIWVSIPAWKEAIRPYAFGRAPIQWLPVPSPFLAVSTKPSAPAGNGRRFVGHFGTYSPLIVDLLGPALGQVLRETDAQVLLLGNGSVQFRDRLLRDVPGFADRVSATGVLEPSALAAQLQACDVMLQPYPDGVSARRTTAIALLAHGVPFVSNEGRLTEPFWRDTGAVALADAPDAGQLAARTIALVADDAARARLGRAGRELHDRLFDVRHAIARLTTSDEPAKLHLHESVTL